MKRLALLLLSLSFLYARSQTQVDGQLWLDGELNYVYKLRYTFQDEISVKSLLFGGNRWLSLDMTPAFEYNINEYLDVVSSIPLSYSIQKEFNMYEAGVMVGTRVYFTPFSRPQVRTLIRFENRWNYRDDLDSWDVNNRIRVRGEFIYPINKSVYNTDDLWYSITDAEFFFSINDDVSERFANRMRFRAGAGYRLNYKLRFEALYTCQLSRNTIADHFNNVSNILRLRVKYYFN